MIMAHGDFIRRTTISSGNRIKSRNSLFDFIILPKIISCIDTNSPPPMRGTYKKKNGVGIKPGN